MLQDLLKALSINQKLQITVWDAADDSVELTYDSYVMAVDGLSLLVIAPPTEQADALSRLMEEGVVIGVILEAYPKPFIFYPTIQRYQETPTPSYWLKIPQNTEVEVIHRRRHVRIPMVIPFQVEYEAEGRWWSVEARTEDVSGGGLRFNSNRLFHKGKELRLNIRLNPDSPLLHLQGTVVMTAENRITKHPDDLYATACQFHDVDAAAEMHLVRECFRRELAMKKK